MVEGMEVTKRETLKMLKERDPKSYSSTSEKQSRTEGYCPCLILELKKVTLLVVVKTVDDVLIVSRERKLQVIN